MNEQLDLIANNRPTLLKEFPELFAVVFWDCPLDFVAGWISEDV